MWVDRTGRPIGPPTPPGSYEEIALSADSKRVAYSRYGGDAQVWLTDLERESEEIHAVESEGSWWFDVRPDREYRAEIGFFAPNRPRMIFA